jgi:hypothetical protein
MMPRRRFRLLPALPLLLLAACNTEGPASQRGFFGGIGAMASGADERGAAQMEATAAMAERGAQLAAAREATARQQAAQSSAEVEASQRRLNALQQRLRDQRATLARLRAERGAPGAAEAARLQAEADALEQERRTAARRIGGPSPEAVQRVEDRARNLDAALQRFSTM